MLELRSKFSNEGNAVVDMAIKIAIGVAIGSVVLGVFNNNIEGIFETLFSNIEALISGGGS